MFEAVKATKEIFLVLNSRGRVQLVRPLGEYIAVPRDALGVDADNCLIRYLVSHMPFALAPTIIGPTHTGLPLGLDVGTVLREGAPNKFFSLGNIVFISPDKLAKCSLGILPFLFDWVFEVTLLALASFLFFLNGIPLLGSALFTVGKQTTGVCRFLAKLLHQFVLGTFAAEMDRRLLLLLVR